MPNRSVVLLQITRMPDAGVGLSVSEAGQAPVQGWLAAGDTRELAPDPTLDATPMILIPGQDRLRVAREEAWGRGVARVLGRVPSISTGMARALGAAAAHGDTPALVVSTDSPDLAALPWELLCDGPEGSALEPGGQAVVVRLVPQTTRPDAPGDAATRIRVLTWAPDPSDPAVAQLLAASSERSALSSKALPVDLQELPPALPGVSDVLHLICHGERDLEELEVLLGDGRVATAGGAAALLLPLLRRCSLVLLDVCHAGIDTEGATGGLGRRLVECGAAACVAPSTAVGVDAAASFAAGCFSSLTEGAQLHAAVAEGRRRVAAAGIDHPEARWHNHRLLIGSLDVLDAPVIAPAGWRPTGFPRACPAADPVWDAIQGHADGLGYLGIEAVTLGLLSAELPPRQAASLAGRLASARTAADTARATLRRAPDAPLRTGVIAHPSAGGDPPMAETGIRTGAGTLTPRMQALGSRLPDAMGLDDLIAQLALFVTRAQEPALFRPTPPGTSDAPVSLVVVGGPEDGRVIDLGPGIGIGRWSPAPPQRSDAVLYIETPVFDGGLSRSPAFRALGGGRVEILRRGVWRRTATGGGEAAFETIDSMTSGSAASHPIQAPVGAVLMLAPGDEIWPSVRMGGPGNDPCVPVTRLRVRLPD